MKGLDDWLGWVAGKPGDDCKIKEEKKNRKKAKKEEKKNLP